MTKVTFRNILDKHTEFINIDRDMLISACYDYAREQDDELYDLIVNQKVSLFVNNNLILPDDWINTELKDEDEVIITPILAGGKGGIIKTIIGIALVAFALWNPLGLLGVAAEGAKFATMQSIVLGLGISLALGGVSELLFRPDLPSLPSYSGSRQTQTYNWQGIQTTAKYGSSIPVVYGTHPVGGNLISAFTDSVKNTENYLYMLISLCEGEIEGICQEKDHTLVCTTTDKASDDYVSPAIEINDQPLSYYDNVEWWYRTGTNTSTGGTVHDPTIQSKIPYFNSVKEQYNDGREITTDYITYTTQKDVDMITLKIYSPALYKQDVDEEKQKVKTKAKTEEYKVQYKKSTDSTWRDVKGVTSKFWTPVVTKVESDTNVNNITVEYADGSSKKYFKPESFRLILHSNTLTEQLENYEEPTSPTVNTIPYVLTISVLNTDTNKYVHEKLELNCSVTYTYKRGKQRRVWDPLAGQSGAYVAVPGSVAVDNVQHHGNSLEMGEFKVDIKSHSAIEGVWNISVEESTGTVESEWIAYSGNSTSGYYDSLVLDFNELEYGEGFETYDIRIKRRSPESDSTKVQNKMILSAVTETIQGDFIYPNTAVLGLRIKATGQLSGNLPNVITVLKGKKIEVPDFTESTAFDNAYYNNTLQRWEDIDSNELTWDESTYTEEYSNNAILCVRDLLLNRRFGVGNYLSSDDLYSSGVITAIQACHRKYTPFIDSGHDFLSWWDDALEDKWSTHWWTLATPTSYTRTYDTSSRYIQISYDASDTKAYYAWVMLKLNSALDTGTKYRLSVTLTNVTKNISHIAINSIRSPNIIEEIEERSISGWGNGTYNFDFYPKVEGIVTIQIRLRQIARPSGGLGFKLTDASLTATQEDTHYHTWDGVLDGSQSALAAIFEMCDSFRCWPVWYNGKFNFIIDEDETPVHTISMGNMILGSFNQTFMAISEIPNSLIGQFTDKNDGYNMRFMIAKSTDSSLSPNEKTIGLKGLVSRTKVERELKWKLNKVINCTHFVNFRTGLDYMHAMAGDIINVSHTLPSWGDSGRVLDYNATNKEITIDQEITITNAATDTYLIKYQKDDNEFVTATVDAVSLGNGDHQIIKLENWGSDYPTEDSSYIIGNEETYKKEFRVISAKRTTDNQVEVVGIEHLSSLYTDEPTIRIVDDIRTELANPLESPPIPKVGIRPLDQANGIGFEFSLDISDVDNLKETVIQMAESDDLQSYKTIVICPAGQTEIRYNDPTLIVPNTYYFKIYHRNILNRNGGLLYTTCYLKKTEYLLPSPDGLRLKDQDPNVDSFESINVHLVWNSVNSKFLKGYVVEVLSSTYDALRTDFVVSPEYIYTLENNLEDTGSDDPTSSLIFNIYTQSISDTVSISPTMKIVSNSEPDTLTNLSSKAIVGGVRFSWNKSDELDHKTYLYRTKVESDSWSSWIETTDNTVVYALTASEIDDHGAIATVYIEIKDKDWYNQTSSAADTSGSSNKTADNIFKIVASKSSGTGDVTDLYDGVKTSGGITF